MPKQQAVSERPPHPKAEGADVSHMPVILNGGRTQQDLGKYDLPNNKKMAQHLNDSAVAKPKTYLKSRTVNPAGMKGGGPDRL